MESGEGVKPSLGHGSQHVQPVPALLGALVSGRPLARAVPWGREGEGVGEGSPHGRQIGRCAGGAGVEEGGTGGGPEGGVQPVVQRLGVVQRQGHVSQPLGQPAEGEGRRQVAQAQRQQRVWGLAVLEESGGRGRGRGRGGLTPGREVARVAGRVAGGTTLRAVRGRPAAGRGPLAVGRRRAGAAAGHVRADTQPGPRQQFHGRREHRVPGGGGQTPPPLPWLGGRLSAPCPVHLPPHVSGGAGLAPSEG